jgi:hypothetical protein
MSNDLEASGRLGSNSSPPSANCCSDGPSCSDATHTLLTALTRGLKRSSGFRSTQRPELRFRALLTDEARMLFYPDASDRISEILR